MKYKEVKRCSNVYIQRTALDVVKWIALCFLSCTCAVGVAVSAILSLIFALSFFVLFLDQQFDLLWAPIVFLPFALTATKVFAFAMNYASSRMSEYE